MNTQTTPRGRPRKAPTESLGTRVTVDVAEAIRREADRREWSVSQTLAKIATEWAASRVKK